MTTPRARIVLGVAILVLGALAACSASASSVNRQRSPDCKVDVLPNPPGPDYVEVGQLAFEPYIAGSSTRLYRSPYALAADIRPQICAVGGDTLVAERNAAGEIVRGTVFRHADVGDIAPPPPQPSRGEGCEPRCRAGFSCEGGTCIQHECTPACGDGQSCGSDLLCHPVE